jgi:hypothetical protein
VFLLETYPPSSKEHIMPKTQSKTPAEENRKVAEGGTARSAPGAQPPNSDPDPHFEHRNVEEPGQGQLEAEDFYSENHFVDEPEGRNLK